MKSLILKILIAIKNKWFCCHKWKIQSEVNVETDFGGSYTRYFLVCTKCGKLKKVKTNNG